MSGMERTNLGSGMGLNLEPGEADATLRLVAKLPAPDGLAERVRGGLRGAHASRRVLSWPAEREPASEWRSYWMRGTAAAAIVCVVAGGALRIGQISSRTALGNGGNAAAAAAPVRVRPAGGFSSANAVHVPDTLNGPVLKHKAQGKDAGQGTNAKKTDATQKTASTVKH